MLLVDFDRPCDWKTGLKKIVEPHAAQIQSECRARQVWDLGSLSNRGGRTAPRTPATDALLAEMTAWLSNRDFRAFHATRLLLPESVLTQGLLALDPTEHIKRTLKALCAKTPDAMTTSLDGRLRTWARWHPESGGAQGRGGKCALVPTRAQLHDGSLATIFERYGGEFLENISGEPPELLPE